MLQFLKQRWPLAIILFVFVACKIPHLQYAYYWDECWPYAVGINDMYHHGISLMPDAIDPEISRGHPLFFHAAAASWMNIFGASHVSMHSFALLISLLFLILIYEAGLSLFNKRVAALATFLVAIQVAFYIQASFVLFEILVAFLAFASIYCYVQQRYVLTALSLTALFYTKESGLIAGLIIGTDALIRLFNKNEPLKARICRVAAAGIPVVLIGIFFLLQKHIHGWYIFPFYNDLIEHKWDAFWYNFTVNCIYTVFVRDLRYWYFFIITFLCIIAAVRKKEFRYLAILPMAGVLYFCRNDWTVKILSGFPFLTWLIIAAILLLKYFRKPGLITTGRKQQFFLLLFFFIFAFLFFSSLNFFSPRYLIAAIVPALFIASIFTDELIDRTYQWLLYPIVLCFGGIAYYSFTMSKGIGDSDAHAYDGLRIHQHVVDYMENQHLYDSSIACSFLENQHLINPATGFLKSGKRFTNVHWALTPDTRYAIFDNIELELRYDVYKKSDSFYLLQRFEEGSAWAEIYCRQKWKTQ